MRAGQLTAYARLWRHTHHHMGAPTSWLQPLEWVTHGFPGIFCKVDSPNKQLEPLHDRKLAGVQCSLKHAGFSPLEVTSLLQHPTPPSVALPNRVPPEQADFVRSEIQTNLSRGSVIPWPFPHTRPFILLPLSVAFNSRGKRRLILDARFVNLWLDYLPFSYEKLQDVADYAHPHDLMVTRDLRAGYHHVALARSLWPLLGFLFDGTCYCFTCLPFGLSQAPYVFTRIMHCVHSVPRSWGFKMTDMVDDGANLAHPASLLRRQNRDVLFLQAALGFVHAWDKCCVHPGPQCQFLGFLVNLPQRRFLVPNDKLTRFRTLVDECLTTDNTAAGRSALGLLASFTLALPLAPLLGRWLRLTIESARPFDAADGRFITFWQQHLHTLNGHTWDSRWKNTTPLIPASLAHQTFPTIPLRVASDASESAFGAFLPDHPGWAMSLPFTDDQTAAVAANQFSSTTREVEGFVAAYRELQRTGTLHDRKHVQIWTDSQAAFADCTRMRGTPEVFQAVATLHLLAWQDGVMLEFVWVPRSHQFLQYADHLSKLQDPTDWCFSRTFAHTLIFEPLSTTPDIDCLASHSAHVCNTYFSELFDGHCCAVDGLRQPWDQWPSTVRATRAKPLCWVFPPPSLALVATRKVLTDRADAILVLPRALPPTVDTVLHRIRAAAATTHMIPLTGPHRHMVFPSRRVPARAAAGGWKTPLMALVVFW